MLSIFAFFVALAAAHNAVIELNIDGTLYPGGSGPVDNIIGARRIEWMPTKDLIQGYNAISNVEDNAIACQGSPKPPALKAVARAGANVTFYWSTLVRWHWGPVMTYLGRLETADQSPNEVKFFKIAEDGYDSTTKLWANERILNSNNTVTVQLPSDIRTGTYILRTEVLALHGNAPLFMALPPLAGPQFFIHCFNVEILGGGDVVPDGVKFPGAYKKGDPSIFGDITGKPELHSKYAIPGPAVYKSQYSLPSGPPIIVKETGFVPPQLSAKYNALSSSLNSFTSSMIAIINIVDVGNTKRVSPTGGEVWKMVQDAGKEVAKIPKFLG